MNIHHVKIYHYPASRSDHDTVEGLDRRALDWCPVDKLSLNSAI